MLLNPSSWQLKTKFISIIFLVLLIPVSSIFLLKEIEKDLVDNLKQNLLLSAEVYSLQLESNSKWFLESQLPGNSQNIADELFVFPLQQQGLVDGYFDEWLYIEKFRQSYSALVSDNSEESLKILFGSADDYLYLSLEGFDKQVVYPQDLAEYRADQIVIDFVLSDSLPQRIYFSPSGPGKIPVKKYVNNQLKIDWRYTAFWAETSTGFNLEVRFPSGFRPTELQIKHFDVDKNGQKTFIKEFSSSRVDKNPMVWPSRNLDLFVKQLQVIPGRRVWVLDAQGRVLARNGGLDSRSDILSQENVMVNWLLTTSAEKVIDTRKNRLRLNSALIASALQNRPATKLENFAKSDYSVALAANPVIAEGRVIGAILIEENVARVQLLQRKTLVRMLYVMLGVFILVTTILTWYVSRLVNRISRLKNQANSLVDEQGRMMAPIDIDVVEGDEIDDLYSAFSQMGNKLYDYHDYLEKLASRLSHELRTPVAIVRSSLDNLLLSNQDKTNSETIQRALHGVERLGEIVTRMRQASGVRQAMQSATFESIDLNSFLSQLVEGFGQSFSSHRFHFNRTESAQFRSVSPDLLAELMDKLLSNAMDFSTKDSIITVSLKTDNKRLILAVSNKGPTIARNNRRKIFHSLVSIRENKTNNAPNLGLGLYVVRLIAEFHSARASAENLSDQSGVEFKIVWND